MHTNIHTYIFIRVHNSNTVNASERVNLNPSVFEICVLCRCVAYVAFSWTFTFQLCKEVCVLMCACVCEYMAKVLN